MSSQRSKEASDGLAGGSDVLLEARKLTVAAAAFTQDTKAKRKMLDSISLLGEFNEPRWVLHLQVARK